MLTKERIIALAIFYIASQMTIPSTSAQQTPATHKSQPSAPAHPEIDSYLRSLSSRVSAATKNDRIKTKRAIVVGFSVSVNGKISHPQILRSSGYKDIDSKILKDIEGLSPAAHLPQGITQSLGVKFHLPPYRDRPEKS